jgi:hypothetical protein
MVSKIYGWLFGLIPKKLKKKSKGSKKVFRVTLEPEPKANEDVSCKPMPEKDVADSSVELSAAIVVGDDQSKRTIQRLEPSSPSTMCHAASISVYRAS